ncbi:unnamed protein product, partial [Ixodes persulcatus]
LQQKLHRVQEEIQRVRQQLDALQLEQGEPRAPQAPASPEQAALSIRLRELQEQFSELLLGIRRRKSLATDGTLLGVEEDDDLDGGLRRPRRRALSVTVRRASLQAVASTARPLTTGSSPVFRTPDPSPVSPEPRSGPTAATLFHQL